MTDKKTQELFDKALAAAATPRGRAVVFGIKQKLVIPDDFQSALFLQQFLQGNLKDKSQFVEKTFPETGPMGLRPEHIRMSASYKAAKAQVDAALQALRNFNVAFFKKFAKELKQTRKEHNKARLERLKNS